MAIEKMSSVSIIGSMADLNKVVNACGESEIFQPEAVSSFYSDLSEFKPINSENPYIKPMKLLEDIAKDTKKELKIVDVRKLKINHNKLKDFSNFVYDNVHEFVEKRKRLYSELETIPPKIKKIKKFYGLDQSLEDVLSCNFAKAKFGRFPLGEYQNLLNYKGNTELIFIPLTSDKKFRHGIYFYNDENKDETDKLISSFYFEEIEVEPFPGTPYEYVTSLEKQSTKIYKQIEAAEKKISHFWEAQKKKCTKFYSKLVELSAYHEIKNYAMIYGDSFVLTGWIPKCDEEVFTKKLSVIRSVECECNSQREFAHTTPPIRLKNNKFVKFFEFFTETYGLPSHNEFDPTPFVAITYMILFGIMFADVGQGLLVSLIGYLMWKFKKMKLGLALIPCGFASAVFGLIFGSVFGFEHLLSPFYKNVLGLKEKPIEVMHPQTTMYIIYASVGLGVVLLIISTILGILSDIKKGHKGEAIFGHKGICFLIFYVSVIFVALDSLIFKTGISGAIFISIFIILPLILMLFGEILAEIFEGNKDWKPKSWGEFITGGFFQVFEVVLSLISNTMSFLRVGVFVLLHAGLMAVFFDLAEGKNPIVYSIIIIFGNLFVTGMEAFLTGIQVMRLEFYEMFNKFFEGQGKPFTPVRAKFNNT